MQRCLQTAELLSIIRTFTRCNEVLLQKNAFPITKESVQHKTWWNQSDTTATPLTRELNAAIDCLVKVKCGKRVGYIRQLLKLKWDDSRRILVGQVCFLSINYQKVFNNTRPVDLSWDLSWAVAGIFLGLLFPCDYNSAWSSFSLCRVQILLDLAFGV